MASPTRQCYFPNGNPSSDVPCSSDEATGCCTSGDICMSNGLCLNVAHQPYVAGRGSCTDKEWGDGCPQYCKDMNRDGGCSIINVTYENGIATYCCGTPITNGTDVICPEGMDSFQIPTGHALTGVALLSNVSSSSATTAPSSTDTATRSCHDTAIGAGVGVPLGVIALMTLAWAIFERRARRAMRTQVPPATVVSDDKGGPYVRSRNGPPSELPHTRDVAELMDRNE
ncbi:uncharacterized protein P174DRAFT_392559 [Aspergillus novofumigatus IBT 16806]|uniref:Mid2 domain-containing protein n=1 Tax=Aspergillus novofumigatus (strain IBT 16806) TaxID=1392255 RepID=A0A2I1C1A2_ASPN1|nr:uncharacterized protein P174DRAFT_392559 [Aspergillus novofumigatus IBT 16806]PKX91361.1 hypothetical protein P174DRAFT_392559 [Aspergillus novofumigatus IBT 16806]